jgi:CelD/BcsL family acetyltransferase involved in cellulose biosynthesis
MNDRSQPCTARWLDTLVEDEADGARFDQLVAAVAHATVFNTREWMSCAAGHVATGRRLLVLRLESQGRLFACLPFTAGLERLRGIPARTLRMLGHPYSDRIALPVRPGDSHLLHSVVDALLACPSPWDALVLSELHDPAERAQLTKALSRHPELSVHWRDCARSPLLRLDFDTVEELQASYSKSLRLRLRRARSKLDAAGTVRFERMLPAPAEVPALIATMKAIEDASWKGQRSLGIFSTPAGVRFFTAVAERFAARGWLDLGFLHLDDRPISYRFGFRHDGVFYDYNLAFDPAHAQFAPGRLLLDHMIVSSHAAGLARVDASRSSVDEPHLLADWSGEHVDHAELWVLRPTVSGRVLAWARRHVHPIAQRLRRTQRT